MRERYDVIYIYNMCMNIKNKEEKIEGDCVINWKWLVLYDFILYVFFICLCIIYYVFKLVFMLVGDVWIRLWNIMIKFCVYCFFWFGLDFYYFLVD